MALGLSGEFLQIHKYSLQCYLSHCIANRSSSLHAKSCELQQLNRRLTQCSVLFALNFEKYRNVQYWSW